MNAPFSAAICKAEIVKRHNHRSFKWYKFFIYEYKGFGITVKSPFSDIFVFMFICLFYFDFHVYYLYYND
jgi:hypothetical protein